MIKQNPRKWAAGAGGSLWDQAGWRVVLFWPVRNLGAQLRPAFLGQQGKLGEMS